jgi:predicted porin
MKNTLITLAGLLASLAAANAAAQGAGSSVTIYGLVDAAVRHASNTNAARDKRWTMEDGIFTGTRLGLRGREDLGGSWAAQFTIESGFDPSTGTSLQGTATADFGNVAANPRFWGREAHVSLRAPFGALQVGRQYTLAHTLAARFQPLGNPNSTAHSLFSSHHVPRQDNMMRLDTKVAGIDFSATHTFGEQASGDANGAWAAGAGYTGKGFALAAYVQQMENLAGSERRRVVGAGGNWRINTTVALYGGVMQRTSRVSPQENLAWTLGANVELGKDVTLSLAHFDDEQSGSAALNGSRTVSWITASYRFSRRTDVYAVIDVNKIEGGYARPAFIGATPGTQTGAAAGLRHRF